MFVTDLKQLEQFKGVPGIYRFYFIKNNKNYIGEAMNLWDRVKNEYRDEIKSQSQRPIIKAIRKHTWDNIQIEILDWGEHLQNPCIRQALETACIIEYRSLTRNYNEIKGCGYNICLFGCNRQGIPHSKETREKFKNRIVSQKTKHKMSTSKKQAYIHGWVHPMKGKHHSTKTKEKMSQKHTGQNNARFDFKIYKFTNLLNNEIFEGTRYDFCIKFNLFQSNVTNLVSKKLKSYRKWILI